MPRIPPLLGIALTSAALSTAALSGATLTGCESLVDCSTEARASVQLTVVDTSGAAISGASATYTIEGENWPAPQPCEDMGDGTLVCGWEVDDTFHITIEAAGYITETLELDVFADECHVITEQETVTMRAL